MANLAFLSILLAWISLLFLFLAPLSIAQSISTPFGAIHGATDPSTGVATFLGVPFAEPPLGSLRFMLPQLVAKTSSVINATSYAAPCAQFGFATNPASMLPGSSEDCLYLNIFVPPSAAKESSSSDEGTAASRPVLVFIHGGAYAQGAANIYPGQDMSLQTNSIVVTIQVQSS